MQQRDLLIYPTSAAIVILLIVLVMRLSGSPSDIPSSARPSIESAYEAKAWIRIGMSQQTIAAKLGEPDSTQSMGLVATQDYWYYNYSDGRLQIVFFSDRVEDANIY